MIHMSLPFTSTLTSWSKHFKKNKTSLMLLALVLVMLLPIDSFADKAKVVLTGEDAKAYKEFLKTQAGSYGAGFGAESLSKIMWFIIANAIAWIFVMGSKIIEWYRGDARETKKAAQESRENWIQVASDIAYMKEHMVTEPRVSEMIRDEIRYLREHKM